MIQNILKYKEFIGSINFSDEDGCFFGKIEDINNLVTYEGGSIKELKKAFYESLNDYLEINKESIKKNADKKILNHP